jgi:hypothetical protein
VNETALPDLPETLIVGIGHKARQGKNLTGTILLDIFRAIGVEAREYSFASALYDFCRINHGMTVKDAPLLQRVGVEQREKDVNTWVRTVFWRIAEDKPSVAIITDVRFPNEADAVKANMGYMVKVSRYHADGSRFVDPSRPADHISETALDGFPFDMTLANRFSIDHLKRQALIVANQILVQKTTKDMVRKLEQIA